MKSILIVLCIFYGLVNANGSVKSDNKIKDFGKIEKKVNENEKTVAKRGIFGHNHHHHRIHYSFIPASSLGLRPAHVHRPLTTSIIHRPIAAVPAIHHKPAVVFPTATVVHQHRPVFTVPAAPRPIIPVHAPSPTFIHKPVVVHSPPAIFPAPRPALVPAHQPALVPISPPIVHKPAVHPFTITPGGATVTSYSVNYPRFPIVHRVPHFLPVPEAPKPIVPAFPLSPTPLPFAPIPGPAFPFNPNPFLPAPGPTIVPFPPLPPPQVFTKPIVPVAIPFPDIQKPKIPVIIHNKPIFPGGVFSSNGLIPIGQVHPQFLPIPVPQNPQSASDSGINNQQHETNKFTPTSQTMTVTMTPQSSTMLSTSSTHSSDSWRPVQPTPSTSTAHMNKPSPTYLPPHMSMTPSEVSSLNMNALLLGTTSNNGNAPTPSQLHFAQLQNHFQQQLLHQQQQQQEQFQQLQHFQSESKLTESKNHFDFLFHFNGFLELEFSFLLFVTNFVDLSACDFYYYFSDQQDYQTENLNLNYDTPSNNGHYQGPTSYEVPQRYQ